MKFELGEVVVTRGIGDVMTSDNEFTVEVLEALANYSDGDWGKTCEEDAAMNDEAVESGDDRILAVYGTSKGDIWIITEWDRSVTTILFPSEY